MLLLPSADIFQNHFFSSKKKKLSKIPSVSNSVDQALHVVRPDLGPNCLQRLSADVKGKKLNIDAKIYMNIMLYKYL